MSSFPLVLTNPINEGQETSDPKSAKCKPGWLKILHDFKINPALPQAFYPHAYKAAVKYRNDFPNHFCKEIYGSRSKAISIHNCGVTGFRFKCQTAYQ